MAFINYDLFPAAFADNCELKHLAELLAQLDFSELIEQIRRCRKGKGRRDWPIAAMLNAIFAIDILQHRSTSSFIRELKADCGVDTMLRTEDGVLYCQCPRSGQIRPMHCQGREPKRDTLKWVRPAAVYDLNCPGQAECCRMGQVRAGAKTRIVRVKIEPQHLRNFGPLPPNSYKWQRYYDQRSAMERIYSRVDQAHLAHDHFLRGKARLQLKFTIGFTVMLARACVVVKSRRPDQMRSWASSLAA